MTQRLAPVRGGVPALAALAAIGVAACAGPAPAPSVERIPSVASFSRASASPPALPSTIESSLPMASASPAVTAPPIDPPPAAPPVPRLTSRGYTTWIYGRPVADTRYLGYVRYGHTVALRGVELTSGRGCPGGFYSIEPRGYVCNDATVVRDPPPSFSAPVEATAPRPGPFPYHHALSSGAPMYDRLPTSAEQRKAEIFLGPPGKWASLPRGLSAHEDLATSAPIAADGPTPPFLLDPAFRAEGRDELVRQSLPPGSMLSFTRAFAVEGRVFLLSTDQTLVPADRVRAFRPSDFHGVRLDEATKLPLAWIRERPRPRHLRGAQGTFAPGDPWPLRAVVPLTGATIEEGGSRYLEARERGPAGERVYLAERDATVVEALSALPAGASPDQKMIVVRLTQGTLVAYEGLRPVYATLMSPGAGGVPSKGGDPVKASTTPLGTYYVTFKDRAATMSPEKGENRKFFIADVPHIQYFNPPFAIHAAYWHERFGEPTSAGCINVSPIDAEALFQWSDPQVPAEWQGATGSGAPENGKTTAVVVRR